MAEFARRGLSEAQIDELTEPLGLRLPVELRVWWRWHDGVDYRSHGPGGEVGYMGLALSLHSLADQVASYRDERAFAEEATRGGFHQVTR